jgi:hypothetical protein
MRHVSVAAIVSSVVALGAAGVNAQTADRTSAANGEGAES